MKRILRKIPRRPIESPAVEREQPWSKEKQDLFLENLRMCSSVFDFSDQAKNAKEKEEKLQILLDLKDVVETSTARFSEMVLHEATKMVEANIFRSLPLSSVGKKTKVIFSLSLLEDQDPMIAYQTSDDEEEARFAEGFKEEEVPVVEPAWPHLQIVYEFFFRLVASPDTDARIARRYIDRSFILRLISLFDSEVPREREYLKVILHRIYGKFMIHRPFIRNAVNDVFYQFIYETEKHNGIAELLEFLGSVVSGFAIPLKDEHLLFLVRVLVPLHKPKCLELYHDKLAYCITGFVEKNYKLAATAIRGLLKYWPFSNSSKEVLFLKELEEILKVTRELEFQNCMMPLVHQIARCISSPHFQVAERALSLFNNDRVVHLIFGNLKIIFPIIFPAIESNIRGHWKQDVRDLSEHVMKLLLDASQEISMEYLLEIHRNETTKVELAKKFHSDSKQIEVLTPKVMNTKILEWEETTEEDQFNMQSVELMKPFQFQWEPPPKGWIKVNFAGVVQQGDRAGAGALIRDSCGNLLCAVALMLDTFSVPSSEFRGAWEGLKLASSMEGYDGVWLEGNSQRVISWIEKATKEKRSFEYKPSLVDIIHWFTSFSDCQCTHMYLDGNKPANFLAEFGISSSRVFTSEDDIPPELLSLIEQDRNGEVYVLDDPWMRCWIEWSGPSIFKMVGSSCRSSLSLDSLRFDS